MNYKNFTTITASKKLEDLEKNMTSNQKSYFGYKINRAIQSPVPLHWKEVEVFAEEARQIK